MGALGRGIDGFGNGLVDGDGVEFGFSYVRKVQLHIDFAKSRMLCRHRRQPVRQMPQVRKKFRMLCGQTKQPVFVRWLLSSVHRLV